MLGINPGCHGGLSERVLLLLITELSFALFSLPRSLHVLTKMALGAPASLAGALLPHSGIASGPSMPSLPLVAGLPKMTQSQQCLPLGDPPHLSSLPDCPVSLPPLSQPLILFSEFYPPSLPACEVRGPRYLLPWPQLPMKLQVFV